MKVEEAYVSFEVAKLLKEKGFKIDTSNDYWKIGEDGTRYFMSSIGAYTSDINNKFAFYRPADTYPCPTQQMAMRWLREVHTMGITIGAANTYNEGVGYYWHITDNHPGVKWLSDTTYCKTYEEAAEAAIKYCLENLIKK